jgi:hypothetical protein
MTQTPPPESETNRRATRRKGLRQACALVLPDQTTRPAITADAGVDGLSFLCSRPITPGTRCEVRFDLPLSARVVSIQGEVKTVYSSYSGADGFKIGAVFTRLDEGSAAALREFIAAAP